MRRGGVGVLRDDVRALTDHDLGRVSFSLPGSNQEFTHTTLTLKSGLTDWAPSMKALMPRTTSGMGKEAT